MKRWKQNQDYYHTINEYLLVHIDRLIIAISLRTQQDLIFLTLW